MKTWGSAQSYCRTHYTDLVTIDSEEENLEVKKIIPTNDNAWIGLYRVPWLWSDKTQNSFRNQGSVDFNSGNQHCVLQNPSHLWSDNNCYIKTFFICHQVVRMATTTVKIATVTDADLTDPAINAQVLQQLGALLTRQGWTDFQIRWKTEPKKKDKN
ncbi:dromaiocalcin-1-like [Fundulus heteroclitus]|uniref:dromaiocalcin-1-like n=1 Tax=Fundulus heteroclitus TaxID=8078 RepID=UPI00165C2C7B|nr:dromaiocalcin-1-like [Fundulus heteroclitus]